MQGLQGILYFTKAACTCIAVLKLTRNQVLQYRYMDTISKHAKNNKDNANLFSLYYIILLCISCIIIVYCFLYARVLRAGEIQTSEAPNAFKLVGVQPSFKVYYFSVMAERHQKKWMSEIKAAMLYANGKG